jgi:hypothetical protein
MGIIRWFKKDKKIKNGKKAERIESDFDDITEISRHYDVKKVYNPDTGEYEDADEVDI